MAGRDRMTQNPNYTFLLENKASANPILLQGGTRSGKTYAVLQFIINVCLRYKNSGMVVSICRKTMPSIKATVMRDFFELLKEAQLYSEAYHVKSEHAYYLAGNLIEFVNLDDEQKIRGRKRNMLYVNEANEIGYEEIKQLMFRTTGLSIFDYNPSLDEDHWLISDMLNRPTAKRIITTYKDNPHLSPTQILEIENLKNTDEHLWRIFGEGEISKSQEHIFKNLIYYTDEEEPTDYEWKYFGGDFGYTAPSVLVQVKKKGRNLYIKTILCEAGLTNQAIAERLKDYAKELQVWDSAEMKSIAELRNAGLNIWPAEKGPGSVYHGLQMLKNFSLHLHKGSEGLVKEFQRAKWEADSSGNLIRDNENRPIHKDTNAFHHLAAVRYVVTKFLR